MSLTLPTTQSNESAGITAAFRKEVSKSILAIIAFIVVYMLLIALAGVLALLCLYAGYSLMAFRISWLTVLGGLGIIGLGVMVFFFLIKFLFDKSKEDVSDSIEITAADQPRLVAFIHDVAKEVGTRKPKKIYITHDVNACVFYNSSFWSMFLPVRKNLKIGLGLVNAVNVGEFKAVVAHEFGHFSQRSMKLGSFVYNVNHIIYNLLFKNTGYAESLNAFAGVHAIFLICAKITSFIIQGIQWILQQMYKMINLSYLGLSRQMEFHADLVAARTSGSNNIITSLQRIEFASACYNTTLSMYEALWKENKRATDLYSDHSSVIRHFANTSNCRLEGELPVVTELQENNGEGRINISNQWASHPTTRERKEFLDKFDLAGPVNTESAWSLVENAAALKTQLTRQIYLHQEEFGNKAPIDNAEFEKFYYNQIAQNALPEIFSGYYDNRLIKPFDLAAFTEVQAETLVFQQVFTAEVKNLPKQINSLEADIEVLKKITEGTAGIKTFDLHGRKYKAAEAEAVLNALETELKEKQETLIHSDRKLAQFFYQRAAAVSPNEGQQFMEAYHEFFKGEQQAKAFEPVFAAILQKIQPLYERNLSLEEATNAIEGIKSAEMAFKKELQKWIDVGIFGNDQETKEKALKFIHADYQYFSGTDFFNNELEDLKFLVHNTWHFIVTHSLRKLKLIAEKQASLLNVP